MGIKMADMFVAVVYLAVFAVVFYELERLPD
jgi:hypothetical protein